MTVENVLLVVIDALRADRVGAYNNTNLTPNIDTLSSEGEVFEQCYSCINATDPSLTTMLTGQYPTRHGLINHGERVTNKERQYISGTQSLAEQINNTHTTIAVDILERWHQQGFTYYLQDESDIRTGQNQQVQIQELLSNLIHLLPDSLEQNLQSIHRQISRDKDISQIQGNTVTKTVLSAIEQSEEPWFALAHYWDTHIPYKSSDYSEVVTDQSYEDDDKPLTELHDTIEGSSWAENLYDGLLDDAETVGDVKRQYDAAVYRTDHEVGRLVNHLKRAGEFENTAIIVTADHGESMTEHNIFFDHHGLYDQSLHVPLIIRAPEFEGRESDFVQHFDLVPTVLELLGKEYEKEQFDGISLVPTPDDNKRSLDRDAIYAEEAHTARRRCIRTDSYKYITRLDNGEMCRYCDVEHASGDELYNIESDPEETENIIDKCPEIATRLDEFLDLWINELPDPNEGKVNFDENPEVMQRLEDMGYV